jgi:hypothetical protein
MVLSRIARMLFYILDKGNSRYGNENHPNYMPAIQTDIMNLRRNVLVK